MSRKWVIVAVVIALVLVPVAMKVLRSEQPRDVYADVAGKRVLSPTILASGTLAYEQEVTLVPEVIGRVLEIRVKEGEQVVQGQVLLRLDASVIRAELAQLDAARKQAMLSIERQRVDLSAKARKLQRFEQLRESGMIDQNSFADMKAQADMTQVDLGISTFTLDQTQARIAEARQRLAKTEIRAPLAGKVTAIFIKVGETAVPSAMSLAGAQLATIAATGAMYADVNVDETEISRVRLGQATRIVPAAFSDQAWTGEVSAISVAPRQAAGGLAQAGSQGKGFPVRIRLAQVASGGFRPGMSCRAEIAARSAEARTTLAVPVEAVRYEEPVNRGEVTKATVFIVVGGKAVLKSVETGTADDEHIEILRGLKERDEVVIGPSKTLRFLHEGDPVLVVPAGEARAS